MWELVYCKQHILALKQIKNKVQCFIPYTDSITQMLQAGTFVEQTEFLTWYSSFLFLLMPDHSQSALNMQDIDLAHINCMELFCKLLLNDH